MTTSSKARRHMPNYRLDVTDFGPIAEASVEIRPLTIFVGPGNTGKSYLAVLLYALHQCLAGVPQQDRRHFHPLRRLRLGAIGEGLLAWI